MWTVIFLVKTFEVAIKMKDILERNKIICKIRPTSSAEDQDSYMEILVPEAEVGLAHTLLIDNGF